MQNTKLKILWLRWKDFKHPLAGGAELVAHELAKRLAQDGHEVIFLAAKFTHAPNQEQINGYTIIRLGNKWTVYWRAFRYYKNHLQTWPDLVIDEMNTLPFFAAFYAKQKTILFAHQLCRQIWFYQLFFPLSLVGWLAEPVYLWLLRNQKAITVSESTKKDLTRFGFSQKNISIISEGIDIKPIDQPERIAKYRQPTILAFGSTRPMKRVRHIQEAHALAKKQIPNLQLVIASKVSEERKQELMQKSHLLCITSVKEGWGLTVTEAASQGTPAIAYNVDGLRDSIQHNKTGLLAKRNTPASLAQIIVSLLSDPIQYKTLRRQAWQQSKSHTFDNTYQDFIKALRVLH